MQGYIADWIDKIFQSFYNEDSQALLNLLNPSDESKRFEVIYKNIIHISDFINVISDYIRCKIKDDRKQQNFCDYLANFFMYRINHYRENYFLSFENLKDSFIAFQEIFKGLDNPKFLNSILKYYMRSLYLVSVQADNQNIKKKTNINISCVNELGRHLMNFFSKFQMREDKEIVFFCMISIIRIYFKLRTYRNSKTLVEWVELGNINLDLIPKSDLVTYYYYSGRLGLYELHISDAQKILSYAFNICNVDSFNNIKLILEYLIPLNLFFGKIPTIQVLEKYDLLLYSNLIQAYKLGNIKDFEKSLDEVEDRLIQLGTFLIIDKLRGYVFRNLIKNIYRIFENDLIDQSKFPCIKIEAIHIILKNVYEYENYDLEELELYLNTVIYKGLIKGYIHNKLKKIVFSLKCPFPKLSEVIENNYSKII